MEFTQTQEQTIAFDIKIHNQKIICDYIEARKIEANLANSTQVVTSDTLNRFSRYVNKNFKGVTRDDIVSFLNALRKSETEDPMHKWIETYNLYLMTVGTFFKWLYYPNTAPKERPKPDVLLNIKHLKRKEKSSYKPTDMWTQDGDIMFLKYCPTKRDRGYHAIASETISLRMVVAMS